MARDNGLVRTVVKEDQMETVQEPTVDEAIRSLLEVAAEGHDDDELALRAHRLLPSTPNAGHKAECIAQRLDHACWWGSLTAAELRPIVDADCEMTDKALLDYADGRVHFWTCEAGDAAERAVLADRCLS